MNRGHNNNKCFEIASSFTIIVIVSNIYYPTIQIFYRMHRKMNNLSLFSKFFFETFLGIGSF
ncbi:uncharacterized protein MONOS_17945 [Monocercomonoides exilis]|uniref:uncharacterized protein n=1 Tax=Monocercomonoides exilis TaxID=2049356 RepID=UPI003559982B|nr:hypothetical protein MONOS_17945 [Monocercomonoides exilis]